MINVNSLYQDTRDDTSKGENGDLSYARFNRNLRRAEGYLLKFLTGDLVLAGTDFPVPFEVQKIKDYLAPFIVKHKAVGDFKLPDNYYTWQNLSKIGGKIKCEDSSDIGCVEPCIDGEKECDVSIPILNKDQFNARCSSNIKSKRPNLKKPIAKIIDGGVELFPENAGSVVLEYIRYPKFAELKTKRDLVYNDIVYDSAVSDNSEFGEWAREPLVWFIVNKFSTATSNRSAKEFAQIDKPRG